MKQYFKLISLFASGYQEIDSLISFKGNTKVKCALIEC